MTWTVASDIAERIRNLRQHLGATPGRPILQEELARRAGVRTSQVSQWERGAQRPSRSRLERWAEREGWPVEMFREGSAMPAEILPAPGLRPSPPPTGPTGADAHHVLARFYEVMAEASRQGRPCPPELAVLMQEMYGLALGDGGADEPSDRDGPSAARAQRPASEVPGW